MSSKLSSIEVTITIAVIFLLISGGLGFFIFKNLKEKSKIDKEIAAHEKHTNSTKAAILAKNGTELKEKIKRMEDVMYKFNLILPPPKADEEENLLNKISFLRTQYRLKNQSFKRLKIFSAPLPPGAEVSPVKRLRYKLVLQGKFRNFLLFLNRLETLEKFIKVDEFRIRNSAGGMGAMWDPVKSVDITISSYYYSPVGAPVPPK